MIERQFHVETERQRDSMAAFLSRQAPPFQVVLGPIRRRRTNDQNARLWLLHAEAARVTGYSPGEMHEFALCRYFGAVTIECDGAQMTRPRKRSSQRDRKEFRDFMESTESWYAESFGCWLK